MTLRLSDIDVVILCGGRGSRLGKMTLETPKSLLPISDGVPFLSTLLQSLKREGFKRCLLAVQYLHEQFETFCHNYREVFSDLSIVREETPLGTGGGLRNALEGVRSEIFVALNGDSFMPQPLLPVVQSHQESKSLFTMVAVRADRVVGGASNKGGLEISSQGEMIRFSGHRATEEQWVNGGRYIGNTRKVRSWPRERYDLETTLASLMEPDKVFVYRSDQRLLDIGTPECLAIAEQGLKNLAGKI